ncbi:membrane fusion protein (multidrug efflux system) [Marinomonas alcarazii]|uniref:Membrane fusion protein (Multidrug efflux system) n=1 Tax=Marinomonas alcarazii TaxID=491949 RepID=A0A318V7P6_9GAMM|nr:efflux RND transporter periplasmic adaptor subunit [Marinomonas alcarazii]PYF84624.1 membrane fusion protein (multidrug efflux system) [Marinomonas alcarazii]
MTEIDKHSLKKKNTIVLLAISVVVVCVGIYIWWLKIGRFYETTEDAYVSGNIVNVMSQVSGTVTDIMADNTSLVSESDQLVRINPVDAQLALQQAEASLASTIRSVRNSFASLEEQEANVRLAKISLDKAQQDYQRRVNLKKNNLISNEDLSHYESALTSAKASYNLALKSYDTNKTKVDNTTVLTHPDVLKAESVLKAAWLTLNRTSVLAPASGYVAQRSVQVGQHVAPGTTLMSVIPLKNVWVTANFKETQLGHIRAGQPVTLTSDIYGSSVTYHGKVKGIEPGTGSAFSLLPASNATGNWIKTVQRVPVRIVINPDELQEHPLRPGLSMSVNVDTHNAGAPVLTSLADVQTPWRTRVFDHNDEGVNVIIQKIIKESL